MSHCQHLRPRTSIRDLFTRCEFARLIVIATITLLPLVTPSRLPAQALMGENEADYLSAVRLIPATAAGVVRVVDLPDLCVAWQRTTLYGLRDDEVMEPLIEANFGPGGTLWQEIGEKIGVRPKDLLDIGSGEVVVAWLPFENDRRQPSSLCVVADIRGNEAAAQNVIDRIDQDLKNAGASRQDVDRGGQTVRVYQPKTKPGQLKIEQVVIAVNNSRIIASDRDSVAFGILDAIAASGRGDALATDPLYNTVADQVAERIEIEKIGSAVQWFVRPLPMGRIIRDVAKVDRGNKVKILNLLENQGFDAVKAMGGTVVVHQDRFDFLHRGYIHAPPVTDEPDRYRLAARMLQFPNANLYQLPQWVPRSTASVTQLNWKMEQAFWAAETLVDEAFNDKIFRPTIAGIRNDEEGPQIDVEKNVLPNLGSHLLLMSDNTEPVTVDSERLLVAIEVVDEAAIRAAVGKAMKVEPDVTLIQSVPGVDVWKVQRGGGKAVDDEFFDDFQFEEAIDEKQEPILDSWAIAVVGQGKGSTKPYLIFASHADYLLEVATRIGSGAGDGLASLPEIQQLLKTTQEIGADQVAIQRIVRFSESLRTKYELQRRGELRENDSVLASVIRRLFEPKDESEIERPNVQKWPEFPVVQPFLRNASSYVETTDTGWNLTAFLLH